MEKVNESSPWSGGSIDNYYYSIILIPDDELY